MIAGQQVSIASQLYLSDEVQGLASSSEYCGFLFNAAQRLLSVDAHSLADRCIQKGLRLLTSHSQGTSTFFDGSLWLAMASSALSRDDLESCGVWLCQGRQRFLKTSESSGRLSAKLLRWNGDCCSIEACLQAALGNMEQAESLLSRAHQFHLTARAFSSAATDLLLRSRLRMLGIQWHDAVRDLLEARRLIERVDSGTEDHCGEALRQIIEHDFTPVRVRRDQLEAANWN